MSPSPNWEGIPDERGEPEWHYGDGGHDAGLWLEDGRWQLSFALDIRSPWQRVDLGEHADERLAMTAAEQHMDFARMVKDAPVLQRDGAMSNGWQQRQSQWEDVEIEYTRVDDYTGQEAILWQQEGEWGLWFADPVVSSYRGLGIGEHSSPELAMTAADAAMDQARETALQRIDHYRTPLPHMRLQVARFNDGHPPTFYKSDLASGVIVDMKRPADALPTFHEHLRANSRLTPHPLGGLSDRSKDALNCAGAVSVPTAPAASAWIS